MRTFLTICASVALLAGCAQRGPAVTVSGGPLPSAKSYAIVQDRPATGAEPAVATALQQAGLSPVAAERKPDYLVEVAFADRPARTGAYVPGPTPASPPAAWLETGVKPGLFSFMRKGAQEVTVRVIDNATGNEARKVSASQYYWRSKPEAPVRLGAAAAQALTTP